ncbi:MAG: alanine racemase, partial [Bacteroidota bacterium]
MSDQAYFRQLNQMLKNHSRALPSLLLDLDRLDENIAVLNKDWNPHAQFRIVVKSLPCMGLLDYLMEKTKTKKLMVFHQPFLSELAGRLDAQADMLLGKPMPIKTAQYFYDHLPNLENDFDPFRQIQWLVDSPKRLEQYLALAQRLGHPLRINLEIDVGLHRGGFATLAELRASLEWLLAHQEDLIFSGLMGYDPHVVKLPKMIRSPQRALQLANDFYQQCKTLIRAEFPALWSENLTFNGAGSPTLKLHLSNSSPLNDISAGSCLVKPTTFDLSTLTDYKAACFIATPILKAFKNT